jgi:hypothetical protein
MLSREINMATSRNQDGWANRVIPVAGGDAMPLVTGAMS